MSRVLVPLAQGCEELEAISIIDILRRGGVEVVTAGLDKEPVRASRKTVLVPDAELGDVSDQSFDMIALPGGLPGADHLGNDARLMGLLKKMAAEGKYTCAICAAPCVLAREGLLDGKRATGYPGMLEKMGLPSVTYTGSTVEQDGKIITSRGPGTALDFALALVEALEGPEIREKVETALVR